MSRRPQKGPEWVDVTLFNVDPQSPNSRVAHVGMRLTRDGRVNLHDVNRWLRGTGFKVPLRFTRGGIRRLNPDVGWPTECLYEGDPPEEYACLSPEELAEFRVELLKDHSSKMTPEEVRWITNLESKMQRRPATQEEIDARVAFLAEIEARPDPVLDEW